MKDIIWKGTSLDDLKGYPSDVREATGFQLERLQNGLPPSHWRYVQADQKYLKEMNIILEQDYRLYYVDQLDSKILNSTKTVRVFPSVRNAICILHVCHIDTPDKEAHHINIARQRLESLLTT